MKNDKEQIPLKTAKQWADLNRYIWKDTAPTIISDHGKIFTFAKTHSQAEQPRRKPPLNTLESKKEIHRLLYQAQEDFEVAEKKRRFIKQAVEARLRTNRIIKSHPMVKSSLFYL